MVSWTIIQGLNWYINGNAMIKANYIRSIMNNKAAQNAGATSASLMEEVQAPIFMACVSNINFKK